MLETGCAAATVSFFWGGRWSKRRAAAAVYMRVWRASSRPSAPQTPQVPPGWQFWKDLDRLSHADVLVCREWWMFVSDRISDERWVGRKGAEGFKLVNEPRLRNFWISEKVPSAPVCRGEALSVVLNSSPAVWPRLKTTRGGVGAVGSPTRSSGITGTLSSSSSSLIW